MLPTWKGRTCSGAEKKCQTENKENPNFPEAKPLIFKFDVFLVVLYIIFDFTFPELDCTRLERQSKEGALVSDKKRDFISFPCHTVQILQKVIASGLFLGCFDRTQNIVGLFRH